jgi:vanillate O-demethylase monooxygenase subunit
MIKALDYWHPVILSQKLTSKPTSVKLCNKDIVLFRTKEGIGALEDCCVHRRMCLSKGWVKDDCLVCPYHAWSYSYSGEVKSPSTPNLRIHTRQYNAIERYGAIWIKSFRSEASFPNIDTAGYQHICTLYHRFDIPLELVLDNFSEAEHTPVIHATLGYALEHLSKIDIQIELTDDTIRVVTSGPQRKRSIPRLLERILGLHRGDWFISEWKTYFSPIYIIYDHSWIDRATGQFLQQGTKTFVFFNPVNNETTDLITFVFTPQKPSILYAALKPLINFMFDYEILQDKRILNNLASKNTSLEGMRLGRFDVSLKETRKRVDYVYWGIEPSKVRDKDAVG